MADQTQLAVVWKEHEMGSNGSRCFTLDTDTTFGEFGIFPLNTMWRLEYKGKIVHRGSLASCKAKAENMLRAVYVPPAAI